MLKKGVRKYIFNPVVGLLPFVLYIILHAFTDVAELHALLISLALAVVGEFIIRYKYDTKMYSITFYVSIIALVLTTLFLLLTQSVPHAQCTYIIFCEVVVVSIITTIRVSQVFISSNFFRQKNVIQKAWLNEFYHLVSLVQYALTGHLFFLLMYRSFRIVGSKYALPDVFMFAVIPVVFLLCIGAYHIVRTANLVTMLKREEWLPIVTEKGEVTGKIAKSVSLKMKNKFLHPVVRVALVSKGKVFLQERSLSDVMDPEKLDYPFEKYMLFNHEINLAARNSISQMMGQVDIPLKFLLKYIFENDNTRRLVLLFVANVEDESLIKRTERMNGKFWTIKQIEQGFIDEVFSETFELEFEYLKNTVLVPMDIINA